MAWERGPAPRIDIRLSVSLTFEDSGVTARGITSNLSETGVLIRSSRMESRGSIVHLEFDEFKATAEIIWTKKNTEGILLGMKFVSLGWRDRRVLRKYFESLESRR